MCKILYKLFFDKNRFSQLKLSTLCKSTLCPYFQILCEIADANISVFSRRVYIKTSKFSDQKIFDILLLSPRCLNASVLNFIAKAFISNLV